MQKDYSLWNLHKFCNNSKTYKQKGETESAEVKLLIRQHVPFTSIIGKVINYLRIEKSEIGLWFLFFENTIGFFADDRKGFFWSGYKVVLNKIPKE